MDGCVQDVTSEFYCTEVFDDIVLVTEVFVSWAAAFRISKGDCSHDVRATLGQV